MPWLYFIVAGVLEVAWAYSMKLSNGFTRPAASIATLAIMGVSFGLLSLAMRSLPMSVAYPVWTGIGAVGSFIVGIAFLAEGSSFLRILAASLIVGGVVLMKVSDAA